VNGHDEALRTRLKATPSISLYVVANISNKHTVSSLRFGHHQPEYVIGRDHRVNLHIVHQHIFVVVVHGMFCSAEHIVEDTVHENGHDWPLQ